MGTRNSKPRGRKKSKRQTTVRTATTRRGVRKGLEKIPLRAAPAFLRGGTKAPEPAARPPRSAPDEDNPLSRIDAMLESAVSSEESDLLRGGTMPEPDVTDAPPAGRFEPGDSPEDETIAAAPDEISTAEADALLGAVTPDEPQRSGASGAAVLNELVDEIEKDLERDLERHSPPISLPDYRRVIGCWTAPVNPESPRETHKEARK